MSGKYIVRDAHSGKYLARSNSVAQVAAAKVDAEERGVFCHVVVKAGRQIVMADEAVLSAVQEERDRRAAK